MDRGDSIPARARPQLITNSITNIGPQCGLRYYDNIIGNLVDISNISSIALLVLYQYGWIALLQFQPEHGVVVVVEDMEFK